MLLFIISMKFLRKASCKTISLTDRFCWLLITYGLGYSTHKVTLTTQTSSQNLCIPHCLILSFHNTPAPPFTFMKALQELLSFLVRTSKKIHPFASICLSTTLHTCQKNYFLVPQSTKSADGQFLNERIVGPREYIFFSF